MSNQPNDPAPGNPQPPGTFSQDFQHSQVSARIPEKVGRGVFSTGVLVLQGPHEFVLDFVQGMAQPRQVAARVVLTPPVMVSVVNALRNNLTMYQQQFGPPPTLRPPPPPPKPPTIEEIYDNFKLPDELLSGAYANAAMISHSQAEFCIDFITSFYPRSAVACRVYISAGQAQGLLNTLTQSWQQFQQKIAQQQQGGTPGQPPPAQ
jgi:hypothetical protein